MSTVCISFKITIMKVKMNMSGKKIFFFSPNSETTVATNIGIGISALNK